MRKFEGKTNKFLVSDHEELGSLKNNSLHVTNIIMIESIVDTGQITNHPTNNYVRLRVELP